MEYVKVALHQCKTSDVLARDVLNDDGVILAAKDTQINQFIIDKLSYLGIKELSVFVHTQPFQHSNGNGCEGETIQQNYISVLKGLKTILHNLSANKEVDYSEIQDFSKMIYTYSDKCGDTIKLLNEVKDFDEYTYIHCINTAFYSMLIGKWMKMSDDEVLLSIQSGLLHDIGKIDIPKQILNKKGILTKDEFEIIKKHTNYGYERVNTFQNNNSIPEDVKKAVLLHHERIDSSGYPFQTPASKINMFARIVSVADVFDAMTSDRVYKKRSSPFEVFEMYKTVGISMFDVDIVNIFLKNISSYYTDAEVLLNNGRTGRVVYIPPQDISHPVVKVESEYLDFSKEVDIKLLRVI